MAKITKRVNEDDLDDKSVVAEQTQGQLDFSFNMKPVNESCLQSRTEIGSVRHDVGRIVTLNKRNSKNSVPCINSVSVPGYGFMKMETKITVVHQTILEIMIKLAGENRVKTKGFNEKVDEYATLYFDISEVAKAYSKIIEGKASVRWIQEKLEEIQNSSWIEVWKGEQGDVQPETGYTLRSAIMPTHGWCDKSSAVNPYVLPKPNAKIDKRTENLPSNEDAKLYKNLSSKYYYYATFHDSWVHYLFSTRLIKTATLEGVASLARFNKNARLAVIVRYLTEQKPRADRPVVYLSTLEDKFDLFVESKSPNRDRKILLNSIKEFKEELSELGIRFDEESQAFWREKASQHVSVATAQQVLAKKY